MKRAGTKQEYRNGLLKPSIPSLKNLTLLSAKDIKHKEYIDDNAVSVSCVSVQLEPRYCFYLRHPFLLKRVRGHLFRFV